MSATGRRRGEDKTAAAVPDDDVARSGDDDASDSEIELAKARLRKKWELASVINFLSVFEEVIGGGEWKMSAEEIELGLIRPNDSNAKLHVALLKGIPPVNKSLLASEAWVTVLCKKLAPWWPWVGEGEMPLATSKGEEILRYKELDPEVRLLLLKALCEIRADQGDSISFVNDAMKQGTEASSVRKEKIGVESNGISYWYEANSVLGYRLYRETNKYVSQPKHRNKACSGPPGEHMQWETLATNLEEFRKVLGELSSSKKEADIAVCRTIEVDAIPALEKLQKKKERDLKKKLQEQSLLNATVHSIRAGSTRSCRNRNPVSYTFDEYDRMVDEAIGQTKKRKATEERKHGKQDEDEKLNTVNSNEDLNESEPTEKEHNDSPEEDEENDESYHHENADNTDNDSDAESNFSGDGNSEKLTSQGKTDAVDAGDVGPRKRRITRATSQLSPGLKNRLRQRPVRNSAIERDRVPDSDDGSSSHSGGDLGQESTCVVADSEEENDS